MEYVTKTRLPLHSNGIIYPSSLLCSLQIGIILHSYLLVPMGRKYKGLSKFPFLAINAKGGESIKPKAKGPHHQFQNFQNKALIDIFHWYLCHDNISIDILILRKQNLNWYCSKLQLVSCNDDLLNWYI